MNTLSRQLLHLFVGLVLPALTLTSFAQEAPPAAEKTAPPAQPSTTPAIPDVAPASQLEKEKDDRSNLRVLDRTENAPSDSNPRPNRRRHYSGGSDFPFGDHIVPVGGVSREGISVLGSTTVEGKVDSDAVSVLGNTTIGPQAKVGGAAVAVLGHLMSEGDIHNQAVSVLGGSVINGHVGEEAVTVLGNMHLGPKAVIDGDIVVVGGKVTRDPGAVVHGNQVNVPILGSFGSLEWLTTWLKRCAFFGRPLAFDRELAWAWAIAFSFLGFYLLLAGLFPSGVVKCVETFERRPGYSVLSAVLTVLLTPVAIVLLAVTVVGALLVPFLGAGLLFAGLFGKAVMLTWIGRRFTKFFGDGPLAHPAFAVLIGGVLVLLIYTVPIMGFLTYKLLSWLGLGVVVYSIALSMKRDKPPAAASGAPKSPRGPAAPAARQTIVPIAPVTPTTPESSAFVPSAVGSPPSVTGPSVSPGFVGTSGGLPEMPAVPEVGPVPEPPSMANPAPAGSVEIPGAPVPPPPIPPPPADPSAGDFPGSRPVAPGVVWPRANLLIRLGALALDGILIGLIMAFITNMIPRLFRIHDGPGGWLIALAIYGAVMWKYKGTTIGGIVCGLQVVRVDNREIDWATAIVRALACFLSLAVAGLGFIWVAIDDEKQSWHDKIAGTAVVRVPKGVSLL